MNDRLPDTDRNRLVETEAQSPAQAIEAAEARALQAIADSPRDGAGWVQLGRVREAQGELGAAVESYLEATAVAAEDGKARTALGHLFRRMSMPDQAIYWHGEALARQPDELILNLNHQFVLPIIPTSTGQIESLRQRCLEGLDRMLSRRQPWRFASHEMIHHPLFLIYHNCNDRVALEGYGRLIGSFAAHQAGREWSWQPEIPTHQNRRKRIGFLSGNLNNHTNSLAFEGLICHLDRRSFDVVIIHLSSSTRDAIRARIDSVADQIVELSNSVATSLRTLRELQLDLLYFPDIGMHPFSTLLACGRSAPVQVTSWGVPQTSGLSGIDYYLSGQEVEPVDAINHYSENLVTLPGLPCCYLRRNILGAEFDRDYFFLPKDAILAGCLQNLWKIHPDFDSILERIAKRLPSILFVFIEAEITSYTQIFLERIEQSAPTMRQRMILLSRQDRLEYISLASCMDLLLDPPYFSSGITLYDTIHTGTPIVCLEGRLLRNRYTAAAYRLMDVADPPVASTPADYVELVVQLLQDPQRLADLRSQLRERAAAHLYDRLDLVRGFEAFALDAIARATTQTGQP